MLQLSPGKHIHFVGIGGAGLSAIARILLERGCKVSGSDMYASEITVALAADGARIFLGHDAGYVHGANGVLATSAVSDDHVEVASAQALGIPVYRRKEFMKVILRGCDTIAVAGTHGKTTTTSMVVHILQSAGKDPSYIVGGRMGNTGRNAAVGKGASFVIEADEYDNMFHGIKPNLAVVTNVEHDHPDFFKSPADMTAAFEHFVDLLEPDGMLVACADDQVALALAGTRREMGVEVYSYGISNNKADWRATDLSFSGEMTSFTVVRNDVPQGKASLGIPGAHNVLNALAALIVADERGVNFEQGAAALCSFKATARRFEIRGVRDDIIIVDDYAHHPTEIKVNIRAARMRYPLHQIWAVWQPHTFSRVKQFWSEFVGAFYEADRVVVTPIYGAREAPLDGVTSAALVAEMRQTVAASLAPTFDDAVEILRGSVSPPAVVLIFSAGNANLIADKYLKDRG